MIAFFYGISYVIKNHAKYRDNTNMFQAMGALLKGMHENKVTRQRKALEKEQKGPKA